MAPVSMRWAVSTCPSALSITKAAADAIVQGVAEVRVCLPGPLQQPEGAAYLAESLRADVGGFGQPATAVSSRRAQLGGPGEPGHRAE